MWPWPRAWTQVGDRQLQIHAASVVPGSASVKPGTVAIVDSKPAIHCGDGRCLISETAQLAVGKPQPGQALINGRAIAEGDQLPSADPVDPPFIRKVE
jgi:methionyl-tRNA formyltransferase